MQTPKTSAFLLTTKLQKPILRSKLIHRERLFRLLDSGVQHGRRMTLISAPAGYGKTTLAADWLKEANHYAWFSVDSEDNDAVQFFTYLAAAFQSIGLKSFSTAGLTEKNLNPIYFEAVATRLLNEAAGLQGNFILVLDDFHLITNPFIINSLAFLIYHLPPQLHFIILSRTLPSFPLARLRARHQLTEVTGFDLKFNQEEAEIFLSKIMGLALSKNHLLTLLKQTEGWVTGLQLAAMSLQRMENSLEISAFIESFGGCERLISDYFLEEVFNQQPIELQNFLLKTALLERMNASICETITGQPDAQSTLECLERTNLFIEPLDNKQIWFRYHTLFSELLNQQSRLEMDDETIRSLHNKASKWFSDNGLIYEAIQHAVKAKNYVEAARYLVSLGHAALHNIQNLPKMLSWIKILPDEILSQYPDINILLIKILVLQGQIEQAETALVTLKSKNIRAFSPPSSLYSELTSLEVIIAGEQGDFTAGRQIALESLKIIPETDSGSRALLNNVLGNTLIHTGQLIEAERILTNAILQSKRAGNPAILHKSTAYLVETKLLKGDLQQSIQAGHTLLQLEDIQSVLDSATLSRVNLNLSRAYYELNDLKSARRYGEEAFEYGEKSGITRLQIFAGFQVIFTAVALGQQETCDKYLHLLRKAISVDPTPQLQALYASLEAKYYLLKNDVNSASFWANTNEQRLLFDPDKTSLFDLKLLAQYFLLKNPEKSKLSNLLSILNKRLEQAESDNNLYETIEIQNLIALIHQALKQDRNAIEHLKSNIKLAGVKGFTRSFVDLGAAMFNQIQKVERSSTTQRLLACFNINKNQTEHNNMRSGLIEPLSNREMEVLKLIAAGLSNKEISSKLYLAQGTVKKHNNNLFSKLDVHRRTEAIARARQLGIL